MPGLPDGLFCDGTLDESLERIKQFLQTWIEADGSNELDDTKMRHLNINVHGPLPAEVCVVDRRTPEQRLADATSPEARFSALGKAAMSRFEAGDFEEARKHISDLHEMLPSFEDDYEYQRAAEAVHIVLGRLALHAGDIESTKRHLMEAGRTGEAPTMSSFGPNMSLARDLLLVDENQVVLEYFDSCRKFWEFGADRLDEWAAYVKAGLFPDFGANLVY